MEHTEDPSAHSPKSEPPKPSKLEEWESLVFTHREHWDKYNRDIHQSLQKAANSPMTSWLYPFFFQHRLLKQKFVKNMQIIGDISKDEFKMFETFSKTYFNENLYNYYRYQSAGFMFIYIAPLVATVFMIPQDFFVPYHPKKFKWVLPATLLFGFSLVLNRVKTVKFGDLVNLTQWVIEKRKAEVWLEQEKFEVPALKPFPVLVDDMVKVVVEEKLLNN